MLDALRSPRPTWQRRLMLALAACALLVRIAVPSGWMPEAHASGVRVVLCNGMGGEQAAQALLDKALAGTAKHRPAHPSAPTEPCAFAAAGLAFAAPELPPLLPPAASDQAAPAPAFALAAIGQGLAAPPPPAIGPPLRA